MSLNTHGYQRGPAFAGPARQRHHRRPSHKSNDDVETGTIMEDDGGIEIQDSALTPTASRSSVSMSSRIHHHLHQHEGLTAPLHDRAGRPIRRHGTETFGELLLHPLKELDLHRQRLQEYQEERKEWDEKHPQASNAPEAVIPEIRVLPEEEKPSVRTIIHFRHLMGDQSLRITSQIADQLKEPLSLQDDELLKLYSIKDTDKLIEFFHKTKREYSLKIHKTMDVRAEINAKKEEVAQLREELESKKEQLKEQIKSKEMVVDPQHPTKGPPEDEKLDEKGEFPKDNIVNLNANVFLEFKFYWPEGDPTKTAEKTRRPIFVIPDPDLSDDIGEESSATWVELFADVFYVGWLSTFTHANHIVDGQTLGKYAAWFVVMWWTWCSSALYSSRYDTTDVMHHIYKIVELCGLIGMAGASNVYWETPRGFIIGYMVMKAVLLVEYSVVLWASIMSGSFAKKPLSAYVAVNMLSILLWGISLMFTAKLSARFALWYVSIFIEVVVNMLLKHNKQVSLAASHLGERFGLFTIIVLGENCMGFIKMVAESDSEVRVVVANMFGVVIIFTYFFMYFDDFSAEVLSEVEMSQIWMYLHFPLHLCQVAFGIALTDTITIYRNRWDDPVNGTANMAHSCAGIESTLGEHSANALSRSLISALRMAAAPIFAAPEGGHAEEAECEEIHNINFVYKAFWVSGGLILCVNALIKLVNTPVAAKWSRLICASRVLNAIVFFALTATTHENMDGLKMLGVMMACLLFQSAVDLLD